MTPERFKELLERARISAKAAMEKNAEENAVALDAMVDDKKVSSVDLSKAGIPDSSLATPEGQEAAVDVIREIISSAVDPEPKTKEYGVAKNVVLNAKQEEFNWNVQNGHDVVLIGAAGTGKTTSMRRVTADLTASGRINKLREDTKWLRSGAPGAAILSYTRKAVNNIKHAVADEFKPHTLTIHKLLEFQPVFYEIENPNQPGELKTTMKFEPTRCASKPLPADLSCLVFEESSMISVELYALLQDAMPHAHQEVFLGDINQLPPIFGAAILGFKMTELLVVELTEVYRQALESPIITLAHAILGGNPHDFSPKVERYKEFSQHFNKEVQRTRCPALDSFTRSTEAGEVKFQIWQKQLSADDGLLTATKQFTVWADQGYYNPQDDIILCPFNKAFGCDELNKGIAQHLGRKRGAIVHEVIAGFNKHYLAVGDRVLYDKEDAFITSVSHNGGYLGKRAQPASEHLDRWGSYQQPLTEAERAVALEQDAAMDIEAIENFMNSIVEEGEDRVQAASHVVTLKFAYGDEEVSLDKASDINNLIGGYAITIHKAQGSEWDKVFLLLSNTHNVMIQRELLYTAVTRAKKHLHIICETDTFYKGIKSQKIKGDTMTQKAEFFKGKLDKDGKPPASTKKNGGVVRISGQKAIKLEDIVPAEIKIRAALSLEKYWALATAKFGDIGVMPYIGYNIRSSKAVGKAYSIGKIALNPVWLACGDEAVIEDILNNTMIHEVCHLVEYRLKKKMGHGTDWKMYMLRMGAVPSRIHVEPLPPWYEEKKKILLDLLKEKGLEDQEDTVEEGEQA
jgi:SprT-like family./Viral (Superfamily 1) RNA helicase.